MIEVRINIKNVEELITEYASIFVMTDMDLGKTFLVKHSIRLTDRTPIKENYLCIPPSMYKKVWEHLKGNPRGWCSMVIP